MAKNDIELAEEIYNNKSKSKAILELEKELKEIESKVLFAEHKEKDEIRKFAHFIVFIRDLCNNYKKDVENNKITTQEAIKEIQNTILRF